ncbi:MAG: thioesterase family protein [Nannocystaceae bacterium]
MIEPHAHVVRFSEVDAAGVAFYSRFFEWCHHAWEELLGAALGRWFAAMKADGWGLPVVHAGADYRRPVRLGDRLRIRLDAITLTQAGDRGRLRVRFAVEGADDVLHALVEHEHAFVDLGRFRPIAAPADFIARLEALGIAVAREGGEEPGAE